VVSANFTMMRIHIVVAGGAGAGSQFTSAAFSYNPFTATTQFKRRPAAQRRAP